MKRLYLCLTILALFTALGGAQAPQTPPAAPAGAAPAGGRGGGRGVQVVSPEVLPDKRITFRFNAPNARTVTLIGELDGKTYDMTRGENGVWEVTVGPWPHDVYNYQFRVDAIEGRGGVIAMDPVNPSVKLGFGAFPPASMVEVPGNGLEFDDAKSVPHGSVRMETYHSKAMGVPRTLWVYTPPGYEQGNTRYPVFYLLHGAGNIDSSWMLTGRANYIMDNLIAEGRARPMIIVNPFGYARQGIGTGPDRIIPDPSVGQAAGPGGGQQNSLFAKDLLGDVVPFIESRFRTIANPDNRALGGLSMGGGQTVAIGFNNTDTFHSLVVMSAGAQNAAATYPAFFGDPAATNKKLKLLWVSVGKDDFALNGAKALDEALTAAKITHTYRVTEGRHEWVIWRHHLHEVAPLMFK